MGKPIRKSRFWHVRKVITLNPTQDELNRTLELDAEARHEKERSSNVTSGNGGAFKCQTDSTKSPRRTSKFHAKIVSTRIRESAGLTLNAQPPDNTLTDTEEADAYGKNQADDDVTLTPATNVNKKINASTPPVHEDLPLSRTV